MNRPLDFAGAFDWPTWAMVARCAYANQLEAMGPDILVRCTTCDGHPHCSTCDTSGWILAHDLARFLIWEVDEVLCK